MFVCVCVCVCACVCVGEARYKSLPCLLDSSSSRLCSPPSEQCVANRRRKAYGSINMHTQVWLYMLPW